MEAASELEDYSRLLFQSLMASARARDYLDSEARDRLDSEDDSLGGVDADVDELVGVLTIKRRMKTVDLLAMVVALKESRSCRRPFDFGRSLTSPGDLRDYAGRGWFDFDNVRCPGGETVPLPHPDEAVVFCDFYECGL